MSNFNEYIRSIGSKIIVNSLMKGLDKYSDIKITDYSYKVRPDGDFPASYYVENKKTASHIVEIEYMLSSERDPLYTEFSIPREMDGAFIIEGDYRVAVSNLGFDNNCRINIGGTGTDYINFDYDRKYYFKKKTFEVMKYNQSLNIREKVLTLSYHKLDEAIEDPEKREYLRLTSKQARKFQVKLDLDYYPEFITRQLIDDCYNFGDDKVKDLIIDKTLESVQRKFMNYLLNREGGGNMRWHQAKRVIRDNLRKTKRLSENLNNITTLCERFWIGGADIKSDLQVPPIVNAVNLESYRDKVSIGKKVAYNPTMSDLIDVADTPINQNVGVQNALTVSTHLQDDGTILFDVLDKEFKKITIEYLDYLNKKVCTSDYVDYDTKKIIPREEDGMVEAKYRMKRIMIPVGDVELIDLPADYRLSASVRQIPFVNFTDSVRVMMGSSMSKQAIPLPYGQKPLVGTGNYEELKDNPLNELYRSEVPGVVKEITDEEVIVEDSEGELVKFPRRTAVQSLNDVNVFVEPKVKVGDKVKKGDVITGPHELTNQGLRLGLNTTVLYGPHHGLVNEDAVVVSESYADRMASYSLIDLSIDVTDSCALKWIAPIGTKVKSKDEVATLYKIAQLSAVNKILNDKLGGVFTDEAGKDIHDYTSEKPLLVPNNIDEATVSDVMIQENKTPKFSKKEARPDFTFARTSETYIKEYEGSKDRKVIYERFPEYIASDKLDPISFDDKSNRVLYVVRIRLIKRTRLMVGSKLTNRFGGKGVISAIEPDESMPILVDERGNKKRCEVVMNPYSTINRKIPSVVMEIGLANCITRIHDLVEEYKSTATGRKKIMPMIKKYYPGRYDKMSVEEFIELHNNSPMEDVYAMNVGCYSKYTPTKIQEMMNELGTSTQSRVLYPSLELMDLDEIKETFGEEEYEKILKEKRGTYTEVKKPLMAGNVNMLELYHMPQYSNKVATDMEDQRRLDPISGRGLYRKNSGQKGGGQLITEMELQALLSRNAKKFIDSSRESVNKELNQRFLNNLLGLGLIITDEKGFPQGGSQLKSNLEKMKNKYRFRDGGTYNGGTK